MSWKFYIFLLSASVSFLHSQEFDSFDPSILSNLSPEQIEMARKAYIESGSEYSKSDKPEEIKESLMPVKEKEDSYQGSKFGYAFFSTMPTSTTAVGDLPLPNDYKISIRDEFTVILSGAKEGIFDLSVKLDGTILFPEIGSISVVGETFGQVKEKISNLVNQSYIGVQVDLSIKNLSAKKITIVGAVKTPGTYLVNPFSTISSSLAYSGGVSEIGTLREIKLIRTNGETFIFDLYDLLIFGDRSNDLTIEAGDTILINAARQFTELGGAVNRPAIYEILDTDKLEDIIKYGLGFKNTSNKTKISVSKVDLVKNKINQEETRDLSELIDGAISVKVFDFLNEENSNILVRGAVSEPGYYNLDEYKTLEDLIDDLDFIDVYPWLGVLEQFDKESLTTSTILFSLLDTATFKSIEMLPNSKVYFASIYNQGFQVSDSSKNMIDEFALRINFKSNTYKLPVYGKFSLEGFTNFLGLDLSDTDSKITYVNPFDDQVLNASLEDFAKITAKKFNTFSFKSKKSTLIEVTISGAVNFPGKYVLNEDSNLLDLYNIIGGFKDDAFFDGIIFYRDKTRKQQLEALENARVALNNSLIASIQSSDSQIDLDSLTALSNDINEDNLGRISGNFSPTGRNTSSFTLENYDSIIIPRKPSTISVLGEVLSPTSFMYSDRISIDESIQNAGGMSEFAEKDKIYIIHANGLISRSSRNIFTRNISLEAGDTIVVPRKLRIEGPLATKIAPITQVLSNLAFSAAAVDNLSNN